MSDEPDCAAPRVPPPSGPWTAPVLNVQASDCMNSAILTDDHTLGSRGLGSTSSSGYSSASHGATSSSSQEGSIPSSRERYIPSAAHQTSSAGKSLTLTQAEKLIVFVGHPCDQPAVTAQFKRLMEQGNTKHITFFIPRPLSNGDVLITEDTRNDIISTKKIAYIWLSAASLNNIQWVRHIVDLVKRQLEDLGNRKNLQKIVGVRIFCPGVGASRIPKDLHHCVKDVSSLTGESQILESIVSDLNSHTAVITKELFLHLDVTLKPGSQGTENVNPSSRGAEDVNTCFKWFILALEDIASILRQHMLQKLALPHIHVIKVDESQQTLKLEIRPVHLNQFQSFLDLCRSNKLGSLWAEQLKESHPKFHSTIYIAINRTHADDVEHFLDEEMKNHQAKWIATMLQTDGSSPFVQTGLVTGSEGEQKFLTAKGVELISKLFQNILSDKNRTPAEFLRILSEKECSRLELLRLRDSQDKPALHMAVMAERIDFLLMFLDIGMWGRLRDQVARPHTADSQGTPHTYGYTGRRTAESLSYKNTGHEVFKKFEEFDKKWRSLSPLQRACSIGDLQLSRAMIESRSRYSGNARNIILSNKCLHFAVGSGDTNLVIYLLGKMTVQPYNKRPDDSKASFEECIDLATKCGHTEMIKILTPHVHVNTKYNALENCALNGDMEGAKTIMRFESKKWTSRIIVLATKTKQEEFVKKALCEDPKHLIDVNGADVDGKLALHHAASNGSERIINLLVNHGADISKLDTHGRSPIHLAVESKNVAVTELLIGEAKKQKCWDKLIKQHDYFIGRETYYILRGKDKGRKAWHWIRLKRLLLHKFHQTLSGGQIDVIKFGEILFSGLGTNPGEAAIAEVKRQQEQALAAGNKDFSLLHVAVLKQSVPLVSLLLTEGSNPNARDHLGATPAHYAAMYGSVEILELLVKFKADFLARTADNKSPLEVAEDNDQPQAINYLESFTIMQKIQNFYNVLDGTKSSLDETELNIHRNQGHDIRRIMIDSLRELNIDVNVMLQELGSGPIASTESHD